MGRVLWNLWARAWVVAGCWTGAFFAVSLMFYQNDQNPIPGPALSYYLWAVSVVLFPWFWPIEKLGALRILTSHHMVCCVICVLVAPFCFVRQPGVIPGFCYGVAAILFLVATIRGEPYQSLEELKGKAPAK